MKDKESRTKRLFLFAGYAPTGHFDPALVYYVKTLSSFGDIAVCIDSDCPASEINRLKPFAQHVICTRHGEYDFGSYKRAYIWACDNLPLSEYDYLYILNDSVYGPLYDLTDYFYRMESGTCDAFGLVSNPHKHHPHIQSWFIGMRPSVFATSWFDTFMRQITKQPNKGAITHLYEQGFSALVTKHNLTWCALYSAPGRSIYNKIKHFYRIGVPFVKKVAFTRNHGALGRQLTYILRHTDSAIRDTIITSARMTYGDKYINWLLTRNPITIIYRNIKHALHKLFIEGI